VRGNDGVLRVEYGEYPQYVVDKSEQDMLESLYNSNLLNPTGKVYTTDSRKHEEYDKSFLQNTLTEYEYNGRKFVRVIANSYFDGYDFRLSNGESYKDGDAVWVEVTPITWLVDKEKDIAVSEKILVAGIQFKKERNYKGDFDKTDMNNFMNTYFVKDITASKIKQSDTVNNKSKNSKVEEVHKIIVEIKRNLKYYNGTKDINLEVEKIVEEYNSKIKMYNQQNISLETPDYLVIELINKLNTINGQLMQIRKYKKEFVEILEYIKQMLKVLDGILDEELGNDLLEDLKLIKETIVPFLDEDNQNKIMNQIRQIILSNRELVEGYIQEIDILNYKVDKPKYKNKKEFEISLRKQLHPILEELNLKVRSKDIIETTKKYMNSIMTESYETHRNGIIEIYFNTINEMIRLIESKLNCLDIKEREIYYNKIAKEAAKIDELNNVDLKQIIDILNNIIKNIYRIELDIDEKIELAQNLNSYIVDFKKL